MDSLIVFHIYLFTFYSLVYFVSVYNARWVRGMGWGWWVGFGKDTVVCNDYDPVLSLIANKTHSNYYGKYM